MEDFVLPHSLTDDPRLLHQKMMPFARPQAEPGRRWSEHKTIQLERTPPKRNRNKNNQPREPSISTQKKMLQKHDTHVEYNLKCYRRNNANNSVSYKNPAGSRAEEERITNREKSPIQKQMRSAEKKEALETLLKEYQMFKDMNAVLTKSKPLPSIKLAPLSKQTSQKEVAERPYKINPGLEMTRKIITKQEIERLRQEKQRALEDMNKAHEPSSPTVKDSNGRPMPLRLLISNKVRNKMVKDLLGDDKEELRKNLRKLLEKSSEMEWLDEFTDVQHNMSSTEDSAKKKKRKQLLSRNYQNAYYQMLALNNDEKREFMRRNQEQSITN